MHGSGIVYLTMHVPVPCEAGQQPMRSIFLVFMTLLGHLIHEQKAVTMEL